jgi:adenylate cyclase
MLASEDFDASERNRKFLTYVVEETLAGRADRIKAYSVATSAFGRGDDFDPQLDPVVRIEALSLRRAIERYYLLSGAGDPVRILIPKGSYVPIFDLPSEGAAPERPIAQAQTTLQRGDRPSIHVRRFEGDTAAAGDLAQGFTRHVIGALTRFAGISVFAAVDLPEPGAPERRDYLLEGSATERDGRFRVDALLTEARSGRHLWAEQMESAVEPSTALSIRDDFAADLARRIAQPYGLIFASAVGASEQEPPLPVTAYDCVVQFQRYWRSLDSDLNARTRACLEHAIAAEPDHAEAIACLSLVYMDVLRFGFDRRDLPDPLERALALGRKAIELAPHASLSHHALGLAYWFSGDFDGGLDSLETGLGLNPNDTELMADLGLRLTIRGEWVRGRALIERAYTRNPALPGVFRIGLGLEAFAHARFEEALREARRVAAPSVVYDHLLVAAAAARLGQRDEAASAVARLLAIDPGYASRIERDLEGRGLRTDMVRALTEALRLAGLPIEAQGAATR